MGNKNSGTQKTEKTTAVDNEGVIESESGGFHVFELHLPTVGAGGFFIILVAVGVVFALWAYRRCKRHFGRQVVVPSRSDVDPVSEEFVRAMFRASQARQLPAIAPPHQMVHFGAPFSSRESLATPFAGVPLSTAGFHRPRPRYSPGCIDEADEAVGVDEGQPRHHRHPAERDPRRAPLSPSVDDL